MIATVTLNPAVDYTVSLQNPLQKPTQKGISTAIYFLFIVSVSA